MNCILTKYEESYLVQIIDGVVLLLFLFFAIRIFFNKAPRFIPYLQNKMPNLSVYLASIGWIPYVVAIVGGIFLALSSTSPDFNIWIDRLFNGMDSDYILNIIIPAVTYAVIALCFASAFYYNFYCLKRLNRKSGKTKDAVS